MTPRQQAEVRSPCCPREALLVALGPRGPPEARRGAGTRLGGLRAGHGGPRDASRLAVDALDSIARKDSEEPTKLTKPPARGACPSHASSKGVTPAVQGDRGLMRKRTVGLARTTSGRIQPSSARHSSVFSRWNTSRARTHRLSNILRFEVDLSLA